jgi:hypothetical protein
LLLLSKHKNLHGFTGFRSNFLQLFVIHQDVLSLLIFVSFDDFIAADNVVTGGAEQRLFQARVTFVMQLMEEGSLASRRWMQTNRDG